MVRRLKDKKYNFRFEKYILRDTRANKAVSNSNGVSKPHRGAG